MSGHNRSPFYLRFEHVARRPDETPHTVTAEPQPRRDDSPPAKYRNEGRESNPIALARLDDAGALERNLLREIRDAVKAGKAAK